MKFASSSVCRYLPVFFLLILIVAVTVGAFAGGLWATLGIGSAAVMFLAVWVDEHRLPLPQTDLAILAIATLLIMAALNFGSSSPDISWERWVRLVTIFLPLILLSNVSIQTKAYYPNFVNIILIAAVAGALTLGLELFLGGPLLKSFKGAGASLTEYNRGLSYLVLLAFPVMAALKCDSRLAPKQGIQVAVILFFIFVLLISASLTESRAAKLALIVGLATMATAFIQPVLTRRVLAVLPLAFLGWPFAVQKFFLSHYEWLRHFPDSWHHRMEIWDYMSYRIMEHPWLGWGLGVSHTLDFREPHGASYVFAVIPASHPHNVVTQLWVELGLPGLILGIAFAFLTLKKASQLNTKIVPFAYGAWAAALCLSLVAYDFWTDSLFAAFAITGFTFGVLNQKLKRS